MHSKKVFALQIICLGTYGDLHHLILNHPASKIFKQPQNHLRNLQ